MYVIDDDQLLGSALAEWLSKQSGVTAATWMTSGQSGNFITESKKQCVILASWHLTVDARFVQQFHMPVVATRVPSDATSVLEAAKRGLGGVVTIDDPPERALTVIRSAVCRQFLCSPEATLLLAQNLAELSRSTCESGTKLTERQAEILSLVASGLSNKAIAENLFIEVRTVKNHLNRIQRKVGAKNRREAVRLAQQRTSWHPAPVISR